MRSELERKVSRAQRLLESAAKAAERVGQPLEIGYSGGKDSDVLLHIARAAGVNCRPIYRSTTIDPPGTIAHALSQGVEVQRPAMSMRALIARKGLPSRWGRWCCAELKEFKILEHCAVGVRRAESSKRAQYAEPAVCRLYPGGEDAQMYMPLLDWSNRDIADYIEAKGLICHRLYYDSKGEFQVHRRLGCIGCPLASRANRIREFRTYPGMLRYYVKAAQEYINSHPDVQLSRVFGDGAGAVSYWIFYDSIADWRDAMQDSMFGGEYSDPGTLLGRYFHVTL